MSDKAKIALIYLGVAVISAGIIGLSVFTVKARQSTDNRARDRMEQRLESQEWTLLEGAVYTDLKEYESPQVFDQEGREFSFTDLEGKVWMFSQFFAACPQCAKRNLIYLKDLHDQFAQDPDFRMVCVTIDPERDTVERLKKYADELGVDASSWLFVSGNKDELLPYMVDAMKYDPVIEREDPKEAAEKGKFAHNMSVALVNSDLEMIARTDLYHHSLQNKARYDGEKKALERFTLKALSE